MKRRKRPNGPVRKHVSKNVRPCAFSLLRHPDAERYGIMASPFFNSQALPADPDNGTPSGPVKVFWKDGKPCS